jgi:hypothetical protein
MRELALRIWTDETFFARTVRAGAMLVGLLIIAGLITIPGIESEKVEKLLGILLGGGSLMIPAGQDNPPELQKIITEWKTKNK